MSVIIIGAGITGLAAAYELAARGVPFQVLEASPRAGGLIRTEHAAGFTIEAGAESMLAQKPAAIELCDAVGIGSNLVSTTPPRTAFVLKYGRLHPLPSPSVLGVPLTWHGIAAYDLLSPLSRARLALEPLIPARRDPGDESVGSFFRRRFGAATVSLIAEPLLGGIHAGDIDALSIASLFPRLAEAEAAHGSVLRAFRGTPPAAAGDGLFRAPAGGMTDLVAAIERRLPAGSIRCNAPAAGLTADGPLWRVSIDGAVATARAVVIAAPATAAARLLTPIDEQAGALCAEIPYVSTASIALAWPRHVVTHPLAGGGFVVARRHNALRITACTWVSSKWSGRAPAESVLLRAFIGGAHDPVAVDLTDDELIAIAARDLGSVLGIAGPPVLARVHRWRGAGAQHLVGQIARVGAIESRLARHPGLFVAGSGFRAVGIPDCVADGRAAAAKAAEWNRITNP